MSNLEFSVARGPGRVKCSRALTQDILHDQAPLGMGLDIVEIDRVARLGRQNPRFLSRIFSSQELSYCKSKKNRWQHFAVRFAAKEAVWKALGDARVTLKDIAVSRSRDGRPGVLLRGKPAPHIQLSLSHSERYALAVALSLSVGPKSAGARRRRAP